MESVWGINTKLSTYTNRLPLPYSPPILRHPPRRRRRGPRGSLQCTTSDPVTPVDETRVGTVGRIPEQWGRSIRIQGQGNSVFCFFPLRFIYFWLCWVTAAAWGPFSGCSAWGLVFVVVLGLRVAVVSLVAKNMLEVHRLSGFAVACGVFLDQGSTSVPTLQGEFLTTGPPGRPQHFVF